jgi:hypothetical protein
MRPAVQAESRKRKPKRAKKTRTLPSPTRLQAQAAPAKLLPRRLNKHFEHNIPSGFRAAFFRRRHAHEQLRERRFEQAPIARGLNQVNPSKLHI